MIAIIDYDIGNLASIANILQRIGVRNCITNSESDIKQATHIILPGNGSFDACVTALRNTGLIPVLEESVFNNNVPLLGICVGAQMLGHSSEEGSEPGLGWEWLKALSDKRLFRITLITESEFKDELLAEKDNLENVEFVFVSQPKFVRRMCWNQGTFVDLSHKTKSTIWDNQPGGTRN